MIENRNHCVRDTLWNEDRQDPADGIRGVRDVHGRGDLDELGSRTSSSHWTDDAPLTRRSMAVDYTLTAAPGTVLRKPP